jgi:hypothetical protein
MTIILDALCLIALAKLRNDDIMYLPMYDVEFGEGRTPTQMDDGRSALGSADCRKPRCG